MVCAIRGELWLQYLTHGRAVWKGSWFVCRSEWCGQARYAFTSVCMYESLNVYKIVKLARRLKWWIRVCLLLSNFFQRLTYALHGQAGRRPSPRHTDPYTAVHRPQGRSLTQLRLSSATPWFYMTYIRYTGETVNGVYVIIPGSGFSGKEEMEVWLSLEIFWINTDLTLGPSISFTVPCTSIDICGCVCKCESWILKTQILV